jgi:transcriptional regulator with XRE-family HTH domain
MTIGERIRQRRIELGLSQEEVSIKAGYKSRSSVNKSESSRNLPLSKVEKMATALECTPAYLMGWEDENGEPETNQESYYVDDDAREMAEFLFNNPEYKVLFDASRKVKKEDIDFVKEMLDRFRE